VSNRILPLVQCGHYGGCNSFPCTMVSRRGLFTGCQSTVNSHSLEMAPKHWPENASIKGQWLHLNSTGRWIPATCLVGAPTSRNCISNSWRVAKRSCHFTLILYFVTSMQLTTELIVTILRQRLLLSISIGQPLWHLLCFSVPSGGTPIGIGMCL
jgi:hypothetical protein